MFLSTSSALWCGLHLLQVRVFGSQDSCIEVAFELSLGCLCNCHVPPKQLQNITGARERERERERERDSLQSRVLGGWVIVLLGREWGQ